MSDGFWLAIALIVVACMCLNVPIKDTFFTLLSLWWVVVIPVCVGLGILILLTIFVGVLKAVFG